MRNRFAFLAYIYCWKMLGKSTKGLLQFGDSCSRCFSFVWNFLIYCRTKNSPMHAIFMSIPAKMINWIWAYVILCQWYAFVVFSVVLLLPRIGPFKLLTSGPGDYFINQAPIDDARPLNFMTNHSIWTNLIFRMESEERNSALYD